MTPWIPAPGNSNDSQPVSGAVLGVSLDPGKRVEWVYSIMPDGRRVVLGYDILPDLSDTDTAAARKLLSQRKKKR